MYTRPNMSHVMCHVSCVMCHMSQVKCHMSHFFLFFFIYLFYFYLFGQGGEAYRWRVCDQRGLPWLVFLIWRSVQKRLWCSLRIVFLKGLIWPSGEVLSGGVGYQPDFPVYFFLSRNRVFFSILLLLIAVYQAVLQTPLWKILFIH